MASEKGKRTITIPEVGELSVDELEEVAGGAADINGYCPTTNKDGCNSGCKPATATTADASASSI